MHAQTTERESAKSSGRLPPRLQTAAVRFHAGMMGEPVQGGMFLTRSSICCEEKKGGCSSVGLQRRGVYIWTFLWWLQASRKVGSDSAPHTDAESPGWTENVITPPSQCHTTQQNLTAASKWSPPNELTLGPQQCRTHTHTYTPFGKKIPTICHFSNPACAAGADEQHTCDTLPHRDLGWRSPRGGVGGGGEWLQ